MEKEHVLAKHITKLNYLQSEIFCALVHMTVRYPGNLLWCLFSTDHNGISLQRLLEGNVSAGIYGNRLTTTELSGHTPYCISVDS